MNRRDLMKKGSMTNPRLKQLDVNLPETKKVDLEINEENLNQPAKWDTEEVKLAIDDLGGTPVFVRKQNKEEK